LSRRVFEEIKGLITEKRNRKTLFIDRKSTLEILKLINSEDKKVAFCVEKTLPSIAKGVELIVKALKNGGRLFYVGAGTSGRLGVLDAAECPPTFGTNPKMIKGIISGGYKTLIRSQEGVEDKYFQGKEDIRKNKITEKDVVVGIAASRRTPYVLGALEQAKKLKAKTIFIFCNPLKNLKIKTDVSINPVVGSEVIMGSTRMKSGTAQKMVLNMLSTASMVKLGKVYQNMMVDLRATSEKLLERSKRIIMIATGVDYHLAEKYLKKADGSVKEALVMILANIDKKEAEKRLRKAGGFIYQAIKEEKR
jgi:N-acetylmuramic acid 6-phosphate etherase